MSQLPYVLHILDLGTKGNKNVYFSTIESGNNILKKVQENWSKHLNDDTTFETVTKGFKNIKTIAPSVYLHFNNFKLLHKRTVYNKLLFTMGISETPNFQTERETIEHICIEWDGAWPLFVKLGKTRHREDIYRAAPNLKGSKITMRNDLAPFLLRRRKKLIDKQTILRNQPHNYDTKLRDTAFKVWLEYKKPGEEEWESWEGTTPLELNT